MGDFPAIFVSFVPLSDDGLNVFRAMTGVSPQPLRLPWGGGVYVHTSLNGSHFFATGDPAGQPLGLWDYDIASGSLDCVVTAADRPFRYAKYVAPVCGELTNAAGRPAGYSLWPPVHGSAPHRCPAIIGQTVNGEWLPYLQTAANLGCYFGLAHRPYWLSGKLREWPDDVLALYQHLAENPNVDTNRVFLWGHSAETGPLCGLLAQHPGLWRGVILFDPGGLPDPADLRGKEVLIIAGMDAANARQLREYQARALAAGVSLKLILQEDCGHNVESVHGARERTIEFAKFLAEDL